MEILNLFGFSDLYAQIAQLVEQRTENPRVAGSIPALGIYLVKHGVCWLKKPEHLPCKIALKSICCLKKPEHLLCKSLQKVTNEYGILAQLVEHLTFNQVVRGSNPRCLIRKHYRNDSAFFVLGKKLKQRCTVVLKRTSAAYIILHM